MKRLVLCFLLLTTSMLYAQTTGYYQDFNNGTITGWAVSPDHPTFVVSPDAQALKIVYARTSSSDHIWDNIHWSAPSGLDVHANPMMTVRIKSTVATTFSAKIVFDDNTDTGLQHYAVSGDNVWRTFSLLFPVTGSPRIGTMYFYLDGGSTTPRNGIVYLDDFRLGDSAYVVLDFRPLEKAVAAVQSLLASTRAGTAEGEFPSSARSTLQSALTAASAVLVSGITVQAQLDQAIWDLYDAAAAYEKSVHAPSLGLVDSNATKQTRYLYMNLAKLSHNALLFGMQDVTGYGVGWSGDDNRSDVKSVCGDYPAVYAEDINTVETGGDLVRMEYRLKNAYTRGGVISFVWHQYDPQRRSFYAADCGNERIAATILPGGAYHEAYKRKLKGIALFAKSLRAATGESIPVLFRPYHEHTGSWFWWGPATTTTAEYNALWQYTVAYLRDSLNVHNFLYCISPSLEHVGSGTKYFDIYPGDRYVDLFGADHYFSTSITSQEIKTFSGYLNVMATDAKVRSKLTALTEVGQELLPMSTWFTDALLAPIKNDTMNNSLIYAAVWRNANTTHFYGPYPGHTSVPNFLQFYNDPYTLFESDLPPMYQYPAADTVPPAIVSNHDSTLIATSTSVTIAVTTNERAFLRYSPVDQPYESMPNQFQTGEGGFQHQTVVSLAQGQTAVMYVRALDAWGNAMKSSLAVRYTVDTLERPVPWYASLYPAGTWSAGKGSLGSSALDSTRFAGVSTAYFRRDWTLAQMPTALAVFVKGNGGAVVYLNDREIGRVNMPEGTPVHSTEPTSYTAFTKQFILDATALKSLRLGTNTVAVEMHAGASGSVQGFDAYIMNQSYVKLFPYGSVWSYFEKGYRPLDVKLRTVLGIAEREPSTLPKSTALRPNYPNPFNPSTRIEYALSSGVHVNLEVYDLLGRRIAVLVDQFQAPGVHTAEFRAVGLSTGVYLVRMRAGEYIQTRKMMLIR